MHPKLHVRFGGPAGETHQLKSRKGAPVRPYTMSPYTAEACESTPNPQPAGDGYYRLNAAVATNHLHRIPTQSPYYEPCTHTPSALHPE